MHEFTDIHGTIIEGKKSNVALEVLDRVYAFICLNTSYIIYYTSK